MSLDADEKTTVLRQPCIVCPGCTTDECIHCNKGWQHDGSRQYILFHNCIGHLLLLLQGAVQCGGLCRQSEKSTVAQVGDAQVGWFVHSPLHATIPSVHNDTHTHVSGS